MPADIIVEATGQPEAAASIAYLALTNGYHVAMVTKEADIIVGPYLSRIAAQAGRFITPVDGDQPSLLIGLMSWAKLLGLDILAAGKSSEYDFIYHPDRDVVSWRGHRKTSARLSGYLGNGRRYASLSGRSVQKCWQVFRNALYLIYVKWALCVTIQGCCQMPKLFMRPIHG